MLRTCFTGSVIKLLSKDYKQWSDGLSNDIDHGAYSEKLKATLDIGV